MAKRKSKGKTGLGRSIHKAQNKLRQASDDRQSTQHVSLAPKDSTVSIIDNTELDDMLMMAELSNEQFQVEHKSIVILDSRSFSVNVQPTPEELKARSKYGNDLSIPRRPQWEKGTSAEQLHEMERHTFLKWRRRLAEIEEDVNIKLTPFEKNLDIWRELWRVVERSDVVVQIVDARHPLLFRSIDLERYIAENKDEYVLLVNKSDLLTPKQRTEWLKYFNDVGITCIFFSALQEQRILDEEHDLSIVGFGEHLLGRLDLIQYLKGRFRHLAEDKLMVGMVGYPNVGKSSTINVLLGNKKVAVAATPGKTKRLQTIHIDEDLILCDCPGLVFPSYVSNREEMVCNGLLPIDHLREHRGPVQLICNLLPRQILEDVYGIKLPIPNVEDGEEAGRSTFSYELLQAYATIRGFVTGRGIPDEARAARIILKDYVAGRLLYAHPPPRELEKEWRWQHWWEDRAYRDIGLNEEMKQVLVKHRERPEKTTPTVQKSLDKDEYDLEAQRHVVARTTGKFAQRGFTRKKTFIS